MSTKNPLHLTLLGDSVIDNKSYIKSGERDTAQHIHSAFRAISAEVVSLAEDGSVIRDVINDQVKWIPEDTTHIAICIGGNDLLRNLGWFDFPTGDQLMHETLAKFDELREEFSIEYSKMLDLIRNKVGPSVRVILFDIYYPSWGAEVFRSLPPHTPILERACNASVDLWNAKIHYHAYRRNFGLFPLNHLFRNDVSLYANTIEPSSKGSSAIAQRLLRELFISRQLPNFH